MAHVDPTTVATRFNDCINAGDPNGLADLMTPDHRFTDAEGNTVSGKQSCLNAWRGFFAAFPDYRNVFTSLTTKGNVVTIVGHSECTDPRLTGPALWTTTIEDELVAEWHVYTDTPKTRTRLGIQRS
jgi:ketosteroid isomerase-like protein